MARSEPASSGIDFGEIDLDRYDFDGLRNDIADIVSVQEAVRTTLKWTLLIPLVGTIVAWVVFDGRMSSWVFYPFMLILIATMILAAINVGLMFVLRNRIAETNEAADRVLGMTAALHGDYVKVRSGEVELPVQEIAGVVARELVFPALFGVGHNAVATVTTTSGPIGWVGARLLRAPLRAVEARVLEVLESPELGALVGSPAPEVQEGDGADVVSAMLTPPMDPELVGDWYAKAHEIVHRVVSGVGTVATGSLGTVLFFATLPMIGWLAFGWFVL